MFKEHPEPLMRSIVQQTLDAPGTAVHKDVLSVATNVEHFRLFQTQRVIHVATIICMSR